MKRDLVDLAERSFDLVVIGAGVYGAAAAWDATLRGLSVALVDKGDFGSGTSFNNLKTVHGGIRYLQHADFKRMRESILERRTLLRIAPHLVQPLPFVVPTYRGSLKQGQLAMGIALLANDLVGWDRNRELAPEKHLPRGRLLSKQGCLELVPELDSESLTGGALWYDAQMYNSDRLTLSFVLSAAHRGASAANFVEAVGLATSSHRVEGVVARDRLTGDQFEIRAKYVLNAAGPWVDQMLATLNGSRPPRLFHFSKAMNLITRAIGAKVAVGITSRRHHRDSEALIQKGRRFLCLIPWRGYSLVGTAHMSHRGGPDEVETTEAEIEDLLADVNESFPEAALRRDDVRFIHRGLLPAKPMHSSGGHVDLMKSYCIRDHRADGVEGLLSLVGVKYTTARGVAEKAIDRIMDLLGRTVASTSSRVPLEGGDIPAIENDVASLPRETQVDLSDRQCRRLLMTYGSRCRSLLTESDPDDLRPLGEGTDVLRCEIRHAVRQEMAVDLESAVCRRTELGSAGHPGGNLLRLAAELMAGELGWSESTTRAQIAGVDTFYRTRS